MKAKEYFEKYETRIMNELMSSATSPEAGINMLEELLSEVCTLIQNRGCKKESALVSAIKEVNQKWNAIDTFFEKKYGVSPLIRNAVLSYYKMKLPRLQVLEDIQKIERAKKVACPANVSGYTFW